MYAKQELVIHVRFVLFTAAAVAPTLLKLSALTVCDPLDPTVNLCAKIGPAAAADIRRAFEVGAVAIVVRSAEGGGGYNLPYMPLHIILCA
jgi:hypothetical protein